MNIASAIQEDSAAYQDAVFSLAKTKARTDSIFRPITIYLADEGIGFRVTNGFDVFQLRDTEETSSGRVRARRELYIEDRQATFVEHPEYPALMLNLPSTLHNIKALASHYAGGTLVIADEKIAEEVANEAKTINPIRNEAVELQIPEMMGHQDSTEEQLKKQVEELERRIQEKEMLLNQATEPIEDPSDPEIEIKKRAKEIVMEKHKGWIDDKKSKEERWWITPEYRAWLNEEATKLKNHRQVVARPS